jgi:hypothetical protein
MSFKSKYKGSEVENLLDKINGYKDPSAYLTKEAAEKEYQPKGNYLTEHQDISGKVDKIEGKGLSTEDFTTALKNKLESLNNFDSTEIKQSISKIENQIETLLTADVSSAIESFNEIIAFLEGIEDSKDLSSIIASIEQQMGKKADKDYVDDRIAEIEIGGGGEIPDLENYATKEFVAQEISKIDIPTKTSELTNDSGFITKNDIPTIPTALSQLEDDSSHRLVTDVEKQRWDNKSDFSGDYNDLKNKPTIPTKLSELENDTNFAQGISVVTVHNNEWLDTPTSDGRWEYLEEDNVLLLIINPNERIIIDSSVSLAGINIVPNPENAGNSATYELVFATSDTEFSLGTIEYIGWAKEPTFNPNKVYAVNIELSKLDGGDLGLAMYAEFDYLNTEEI